MADRANILFIHTDSMDGRAMGCMGHPALAGGTPNLDRLAEEGVLFRNMYCNNPICCPSRASMMSGKFTHHCEGWNNYKGLSEGDETFLDRLVEGGYRTHVLGKTDYLSGQHTIRARVSPWTRSAGIMRPHYRMGGPRVLEGREERVHGRDWDDVDAAIRWLGENRDEEAPFFLYAGIRAPHPGFTTSRSYLERIDPQKVEIPPFDENSHPVLAYQRCNKNWMHGFDEDTVRLVRRIYFAMIAEVDAMVGRLLDGLEACGAADSTFVIFSSDHGELAMEHCQFYKMSPYEPAARVPLIVRGPGARKGATVDELVSLVDVYPTLMEMAGWPRPEGLDGHSVMPELTGGATGHPGWVLTEFHGTSCNTGMFMLRRDSWKFVKYAGCAPLLFDLERDPWEVDDLAAQRPAVVAEMDGLLREVVDCEAVDRKVKEYDRASFGEWRQQRRNAGDYAELMGRIHSGWDGLGEGEGEAWTAEDEGRIEAWLESA